MLCFLRSDPSLSSSTDKERPPVPSVSASRDGSPHSSVSVTKVSCAHTHTHTAPKQMCLPEHSLSLTKIIISVTCQPFQLMAKNPQIFFEFPPVTGDFFPSFWKAVCLCSLSLSLSPRMMGFKGSCLAHERQVVPVVFIQTVSTVLTQNTTDRWRRACGYHGPTQTAARLKKEGEIH